MYSNMSNNMEVIRVETALSRYPLHRLSKLGAVAIDLKETTGDGEMTLRWEVSHNSKWGQPGPLAYKVDTLVINRRLEETGRPIPRVIRLGSLCEIAEATGTGEKNTTKIKNALHQNASAYINARITYRTKGGAERSIEIGGSRYVVAFKGDTLPNGVKSDAVYLILNDFYREILDSALTRPLDYEYLRELAPVAQRWYELASFQVFAAVRHGNQAKLSYSDFCMYAPQTRYATLWEVRKQMARIHELHLRAGYIAGVEFQATTDRHGKPDWTMAYTPGPKAKAEHQTSKRAALAIEAKPEPTGLEAELVKRGITRSVAVELVASHPEAKIRAKVEVFDYLRNRRDARVRRNGPGYLVKSIVDDFPAPEDFTAETQRAERQAAAQAQEEQARQAKAREREDRAQIDAYWKSLTPEEQARLEADALAQAEPETRAQCENGAPAMRRLARATARETHIRRLLNLPEPS